MRARELAPRFDVLMGRGQAMLLGPFSSGVRGRAFGDAAARRRVTSKRAGRRRASNAPALVPPELSAPAARLSAAELAAQVELEPTNVERQLAAAQAYEAERSERRACAHFRAAATLAPRDLEVQYQALRCRARVLGERVSVLADVVRLDLHSPSIDALTTRIRALGAIPTFVGPAP